MKSKILSLITIIILTFPIFSPNWATKAQVDPNPYTIELSFDKPTVKANDEFQVNIIVKNVSPTAIENFELRVPFYNKVQDIKSANESPSFNKRLENNEYPAGFNGRSWLINSFEANTTKTYSIKYALVDDPSTDTDIITKFTLPKGWVDPDGLTTESELKINYFRTDVYMGGFYKSSNKIMLPALDAGDNEVAKVKLDKKYYFTGSKSTNLKQVTKANISAFPDFTLETSDVLIKWTQPIDFSSTDSPAKLKKLNDLLVISWGKVVINIKELPFLAQNAEVTFKATEFVNDPKIKFGEEVLDLDKLNGKLDKDKKITFLALTKPLTSISLYPNLIFENDTIQTPETSYVLKGKTADPKSKVYYKVGDNEEKEALVDITNGNFDININDTAKVNNITVRTKLEKFGDKENIDNEYKKSIAIMYQPVQITTVSPKAESNLSTILNNPITKFLAILALVILFIICGYIIYLYKKKKKNSSKPIDIKDKPSFSNFDVKTTSSSLQQEAPVQLKLQHEDDKSNIDLDKISD